MEVTRHDVRQALGKPHRRVASHAERRAVGHAIELLANRGINSRMMMTVHVAPHAAGPIDVFAAVDVDQSTALGPRDHKRLILSHLRESMPKMAAVPINKLFASGHYEAASYVTTT